MYIFQQKITRHEERRKEGRKEGREEGRKEGTKGGREEGREEENFKEIKQASELDSIMTQISELPDRKFKITMTTMLRAQM